MPDQLVGPQKVTITTAVLQTGLSSIISLLQSAYQAIAAVIPAGQEGNFIGYDKLVPALNALSQSANGVLTGQVDLRNWATWARQTANALCVAAQQAKAAKLDDGTLVGNATATKNSVDKVLATLGITSPSYLLIGAAAAALAGVAWWAYRQQKKDKKSYGRRAGSGDGDGEGDDEDDEDEDNESEGEELELNAGDDEDEDDEELPPPRPRRRPWASKET